MSQQIVLSLQERIRRGLAKAGKSFDPAVDVNQDYVLMDRRSSLTEVVERVRRLAAQVGPEDEFVKETQVEVMALRQVLHSEKYEQMAALVDPFGHTAWLKEPYKKLPEVIQHAMFHSGRLVKLAEFIEWAKADLAAAEQRLMAAERSGDRHLDNLMESVKCERKILGKDRSALTRARKQLLGVV